MSISPSTSLATLSVADEQKYALITSNLQEVMRGDIIREILPVRPLEIYWGTATTGRPHAAYFVPAIKVAQFLQADCHVKVLLADLHGYLDADKAPESLLEGRAQYYEKVIRALLRSVGVDQSRLEFVRGSSYQLSPNYSRDLLRLSKRVSIHDAIKASSEIVKSMGDPVMADGVYPLMQLLDEEYLDVDAEFGGIDQRKTFALANDTMGKMGFKTRAHIMNPMVPGLAGGKMSSSDPKSKIDLVEDADNIRKKIAKAYCAPNEVEGNGVLAFIQHVLLPFSGLRALDGIPSIEVALEGQSETTTFSSFSEVAAAYESGSLTPQIAKKIVEQGLIRLTEPIRQEFEADEEWQAIAREAYPSPALQTNGTVQMQKKAEKKAEKESRKAAALEYETKQALVARPTKDEYGAD